MIRVTLLYFHTSADMYTVVDVYRTTVLARGILIDLLRKDPLRLPRDAISQADKHRDWVLTGGGLSM